MGYIIILVWISSSFLLYFQYSPHNDFIVQQSKATRLNTTLVHLTPDQLKQYMHPGAHHEYTPLSIHRDGAHDGAREGAEAEEDIGQALDKGTEGKDRRLGEES